MNQELASKIAKYVILKRLLEDIDRVAFYYANHKLFEEVDSLAEELRLEGLDTHALFRQ